MCSLFFFCPSPSVIFCSYSAVKLRPNEPGEMRICRFHPNLKRPSVLICQNCAHTAANLHHARPHMGPLLQVGRGEIEAQRDRHRSVYRQDDSRHARLEDRSGERKRQRLDVFVYAAARRTTGTVPAASGLIRPHESRQAENAFSQESSAWPSRLST